MIKHYGSLENISNMKRFLNTACLLLEISHNELMIACRDRTIVKKRQCVHYVLHKKAGMRSVDVGYLIGGKDHATVLYSCKSVANDLAQNYNDTKFYYQTVLQALLENSQSTHSELIQLFDKCTTIINPTKNQHENNSNLNTQI